MMTPQDHQNRPPKVSTPIANHMTTQDAIKSAPGHVSMQHSVQYPHP